MLGTYEAHQLAQGRTHSELIEEARKKRDRYSPRKRNGPWDFYNTRIEALMLDKEPA